MNVFDRASLRLMVWILAGLLPILTVLRVHRSTEFRRAELAAVREERSRVEEELGAVQREQAELSERLAQKLATPSVVPATPSQPRSSAGVEQGDKAPWMNPPAELPSWDPVSPYVWLRKDAFARLPVEPFTRDGVLQDPVADALSISPVTRDLLREEIRDILERQQEIELEQAKVLVHSGDKGSKVPTSLDVEIPEMSEWNTAVRREVEDAFRVQLGEARGRLLIKLAASWLEEQFSVRPGVAKLYSVSRTPEGLYAIKQAAAGNSSSSCCSPEFEAQIPVHLRPLFKPMLPSPTE